MKKIALSLAVISLVSYAAFNATMALFSDTETSVDNTFTAGSLDLKVDDVDDLHVNFVVSDVEPGYSDYYYWTLKNAGTIAGQPTIELSAIDNSENSCIEPEIDAGDTSCTDPGDGELGRKLYIWLQWSNDNGSTWNQLRCNANSGNHLLNTCDSTTVGLGTYSGSGPKNDTALPVLNAGDEVQFRFHPWWHHTSTDNIAQTDSAQFDFIFHLDQI